MSDQLSFLPSPKPVVIPTIQPTMRMSEREALKHFDEWWATACWHKEAKGAARRAYLKAVQRTGATPQQLIDGARRYAEFLRQHPSRSPKHPATWLNAECWNDELANDRGSAERARSSAHLDAARLFSGRAGLRG